MALNQGLHCHSSSSFQMHKLVVKYSNFRTITIFYSKIRLGVCVCVCGGGGGGGVQFIAAKMTVLSIKSKSGPKIF